MPCDFDLDRLFGWVDGEPDEQTEQHVRSCADCSSRVARLRSLGSELQNVPVAGLSERQIQSVAAHVTRQGRPQRNWWTRLWRDNPLVTLLQLRARRSRGPQPSLWLLLGLFALPSLVVGAVSPDALLLYVTALLLAAAVGLPAFLFAQDVSTVKSLRAGRCLEDLVCAGLDPGRLVDTLALYSLRSLLRTGLPLLAMVWPATQLFSQHRSAVLSGWELAWIPLCSVLFVLGSYAAQAAWSPAVNHKRLLVCTGAFCFLSSLGFRVSHPLGTVLWIAVVSLPLGLILRRESAAALTAELRGELPAGCAARPTNAWISPWNDNPIVVREITRESRDYQGWRGTGAYFATGFVVLGGIALLLPQLSWLQRVFSWLLLQAFLYDRVGRRTLGAVVEERQRGSWDLLVGSGVIGPNFVQGWVQLAVASKRFWFVAQASILLLLGATFPETLLPAVHTQLAGVLLAVGLSGTSLLLAWTAAHHGLAVSATQRTRQLAGVVFNAELGWMLIQGLILAGLLEAILVLFVGARWLDSGGHVYELVAFALAPGAALATVLLYRQRISALHISSRLLQTGRPADFGRKPRSPLVLAAVSCVLAGTFHFLTSDYTLALYAREHWEGAAAALCLAFPGWLAIATCLAWVLRPVSAWLQTSNALLRSTLLCAGVGAGAAALSVALHSLPHVAALFVTLRLPPSMLLQQVSDLLVAWAAGTLGAALVLVYWHSQATPVPAAAATGSAGRRVLLLAAGLFVLSLAGYGALRRIFNVPLSPQAVAWQAETLGKLSDWGLRELPHHRGEGAHRELLVELARLCSPAKDPNHPERPIWSTTPGGRERVLAIIRRVEFLPDVIAGVNGDQSCRPLWRRLWWEESSHYTQRLAAGDVQAGLDGLEMQSVLAAHSSPRFGAGLCSPEIWRDSLARDAWTPAQLWRLHNLLTLQRQSAPRVLECLDVRYLHSLRAQILQESEGKPEFWRRARVNLHLNDYVARRAGEAPVPPSPFHSALMKTAYARASRPTSQVVTELAELIATVEARLKREADQDSRSLSR
jgi:hypothetical protein